MKLAVTGVARPRQEPDLSPSEPSAPTRSFNTRNIFTVPEGIALAGATLAIFASAATNVTFAFEMGRAHSPQLAAILSTGALAATLLAASMPAVAVIAARRWQVVRSLACVVLWVAAVGFSIVAAIGASAAGRSDMAGSRGTAAASRIRDTAAYARMSNELAGIATARTVVELAPLIQSKRDALRGETCGPDASRSAGKLCSDIAALTAETARATERTRLQASLEGLGQRLMGGNGSGAADPQAEALASYGRAVGFTVDADHIAPWLSLGTALFLELAAALGLLAAGMGSRTVDRVPTVTRMGSERRPEALADATPTIAVPALFDGRSVVIGAAVPTAAERPAVVAAKAQIIDLAKSGAIMQPVRGLAALIGSSATTTHAAIAALVAAGVLERVSNGFAMAQNAHS